MIFINFLRNYWMWFLLAFIVVFVLYFIFRRIYNLLRISVSEVLSIQKPEIRKYSLIMSDCFSLSANYQVDINKNKLIIFVHDFFNSKADFKFCTIAQTYVSFKRFLKVYLENWMGCLLLFNDSFESYKSNNIHLNIFVIH